MRFLRCQFHAIPYLRGKSLSMIVVTGAAGFIASCLVAELNRSGHNDIVVVDDFSKKEKEYVNLIPKDRWITTPNSIPLFKTATYYNSQFQY